MLWSQIKLTPNDFSDLQITGAAQNSHFFHVQKLKQNK